ncbi:MAG: two-component system cell cycle sensor histidine kinase/response regulator CckA [Cognaticolwellia sp.]
MDGVAVSQESLEGVLLELIPSAVLVVDAEGLIIRANSASEEVLGRPIRELLGRHYCDPEYGVLAKDGQQLALENQPLERINLLEVPHAMRVSSRWPGGTRRRLELKAQRLGQGALLVLEDVTEREEAHRALLRSEQRLQMALGSAGLGIWDLDLRHDRVLCNSGLRAILGYAPLSMPTDWPGVRELIHPRDRAELGAAFIQHLRGENNDFQGRWRVQDSNKEWRWVEITGKASRRDDAGRVRFVLGTLRDVTSEVRGLHVKAKLDANLARLARMESLSILAGGVSHDYNNLLMAMLTGVTVAQEDLAPEHLANESLDLVKEAITQAKALTQQLLAFSGRGQFVVEPLDLNQVLQDMDQLLGSLVGSKVQVKMDLTPDVLQVTADRTQLQQVVMNLVLNAAQAMDGRGRVNIRTLTQELSMEELSRGWSSEQAEPGLHAVLQVEDQGVGMKSSKITRIFEPFFSTRRGGHGLGLAAALGIVQGHRGFIQVLSTPSVGTVFRIGLPLSAASSDEVTAPEPARVPAKYDNKRILVVDDQPLVLRVTSRMLRRMGWQVWEANSGAEALVRFQSDPGTITVALVDMNMPEMSGGELVAELRKLDRDQPVLLMSGFEPTQVTSSLTKQPRTAFLAKPFFQKQLLEGLARVLSE